MIRNPSRGSLNRAKSKAAAAFDASLRSTTIFSTQGSSASFFDAKIDTSCPEAVGTFSSSLFSTGLDFQKWQQLLL